MYQPFRGVIRALAYAAILLCAFLSFPSSSSPQAIKVPPPAAEIATVRAGRVDIAIPAPTAELKEMGPDLRVLMDVMTPSNLRLIAAFIPPDELALLPGKLSTPLTQYALVEVPRAAEFMEVDQTSYKAVVDSTSQQFSKGDLQSTLQTLLDRRFADLGVGAGKITVDKPTPLGTMFSKQDASGFATLLPMAANGKTITLVGGTIIVRAHNRVLFTYLYTRYEDKASIDWITKTSESWADAILKANAQ